MTDHSDTPKNQPKYTEKAYYQERIGQVIHVSFGDNTGDQGRLVAVDKKHIFVESAGAEDEVYMITKAAIKYVRPPMTGG